MTHEQIVEYIKRQIRRGVKEEDIKRELRGGSVPDNEIRDAFNAVSAPVLIKPEKTIAEDIGLVMPSAFVFEEKTYANKVEDVATQASTESRAGRSISGKTKPLKPSRFTPAQREIAAKVSIWLASGIILICGIFIFIYVSRDIGNPGDYSRFLDSRTLTTAKQNKSATTRATTATSTASHPAPTAQNPPSQGTQTPPPSPGSATAPAAPGASPPTSPPAAGTAAVPPPPPSGVVTRALFATSTSFVLPPLPAFSLSNISIPQVARDSALVAWETTRPAFIQIHYGTSTPLKLVSDVNAIPSFSGTTELPNLSASTTYLFEVKAIAGDGTIVSLQNASFTTPLTYAAKPGPGHIATTPAAGAPSAPSLADLQRQINDLQIKVLQLNIQYLQIQLGNNASTAPGQ